MQGLDTCKFCNFEFDESFEPYKSDDWDILHLDDENGDWLHHQIRDRLYFKNIECLFVDIWDCNSIAFIIGCTGSVDDVARALNIHKSSIYDDFEHSLMIINLFEEKLKRIMKDRDKCSNVPADKTYFSMEYLIDELEIKYE